MLDRKTGLGAKGKTFLSESRRLPPPTSHPSASAPDRGGRTAPPATDRRACDIRSAPKSRDSPPAGAGAPSGFHFTTRDPIHHRGTEGTEGHGANRQFVVVSVPLCALCASVVNRISKRLTIPN